MDVWSLGVWTESDVDDGVQQRTADLGRKPVLDASFTGSSQLSYKLINEAMAAPGGGSVLVSIGISAGTGLGQDLSPPANLV